MLSRGCLCDQIPVKTLGAEALLGFPGGQDFDVLSHPVAGGVVCPL